MDDYAAEHEDWPEPELIDEALYALSLEVNDADHKLSMAQAAYRIGASNREDVHAALSYVRGLERAHYLVYEVANPDEES